MTYSAGRVNTVSMADRFGCVIALSNQTSTQIIPPPESFAGWPVVSAGPFSLVRTGSDIIAHPRSKNRPWRGCPRLPCHIHPAGSSSRSITGTSRHSVHMLVAFAAPCGRSRRAGVPPKSVRSARATRKASETISAFAGNAAMPDRPDRPARQPGLPGRTPPPLANCRAASKVQASQPA